MFLDLTAALLPVSGAGGFCVGDDWQAIKGFARSDLKFFERFDEFFVEPSQLQLKRNYRSARKIVQAGNALMHDLGAPSTAHRAPVGKVSPCPLEDFVPTASEEARHPGDDFTPAV